MEIASASRVKLLGPPHLSFPADIQPQSSNTVRYKQRTSVLASARFILLWIRDRLKHPGLIDPQVSFPPRFSSGLSSHGI
jgi:hypothetical protein